MEKLLIICRSGYSPEGITLASEMLQTSKIIRSSFEAKKRLEEIYNELEAWDRDYVALRRGNPITLEEVVELLQ